MTQAEKLDAGVPLTAPVVVSESLDGLLNKYAVDSAGHASQVVGYRSFADGVTWIFVLTNEHKLQHIELSKVERFLHRAPRV